MGINPPAARIDQPVAIGGLLRGLFLALISSAAVAAAASPDNRRGSIGPTSSGTVRISATVAPTFRVRWSGSSVAARSAAMPRNAGSSQLCLESNMEEGQFSVSAEADGGPLAHPAGNPSPETASIPAACVDIGEVAAARSERQRAPDRSIDARNPAGRTAAWSGESGSVSAAQGHQHGRGILILIAAQ